MPFKTMSNREKVAILTAGGLAPCLSSAVGGLIERYTDIAPEVEIVCYRGGYKGLLLGDSFVVTPEMRAKATLLHRYGGSPIGNSRTKLTNVADCLKRGFIREGQDPQTVATEQLKKDGITILHTVGGDDTNTAAADLAQFLKKSGYDLTVVGLPKTVDNDVFPIQQTLGAWTAAEQGARFFENVVSESSANPRMLIVHEVMGRNCGWLTFATTLEYRQKIDQKTFFPSIGLRKDRYDVHAVYIPEAKIDLETESLRLKTLMDAIGCVNIFVSEGAGADNIVKELESEGKEIPRDAFGHVKLDKVDTGKWFGEKLSKRIGAEKVLVQKSGYFARSAPANNRDLRLIQSSVDFAVQCALNGQSGVIGHDIDHNNQLRCIEFTRIRGGKPFDATRQDFRNLLKAIGQE